MTPMRAAVLVAAAMVLVGAIPRILLAADALPSPFRAFVWSDVLHTWERGLSGGRLPYWDAFFEYPPLTGYVAAAISRSTSSALAYVSAWTLVQAGAAAAIAWLIAREVGPERALRRWSLAPQLLLLGSLNFELLAVLPLVLAIVWVRRGHALRGAAALAIGTAAKLFPAVALPVILARDLGRGLALPALTAAVFAIALLLFYLPAFAAPFSPLGGIARYAVEIAPNFDSVWGLLQSVLDGVGIPAAATIILLVSTAGLAATYLLVVLPRARASDPAIPIALSILALLLWTRRYSPQFSLWALPLLSLLPLSTRTFGVLALADVLVFLTVYPLTLIPWPADDPSALLLLVLLGIAVVARHAALLFASRELVRIR